MAWVEVYRDSRAEREEIPSFESQASSLDF
jgi:hypothetical protein